MHLGALIVCQCGERKAIRINNFTRSWFAPGRDQLVAGPEYGDFGSSMHAKAWMVHRGSKHQVAIGQPMSLVQQDLITREVDTLRANIPPLAGRFLDGD